MIEEVFLDEAITAELDRAIASSSRLGPRIS